MSGDLSCFTVRNIANDKETLICHHCCYAYRIGFSGDTYMEWSSLAWQPTFTATSSNVLYYWSHDIGGHRSQVCPGPQAVGPCYKDFGHDEAAYDPELYLRWCVTTSRLVRRRG